VLTQHVGDRTVAAD